MTDQPAHAYESLPDGAWDLWWDSEADEVTDD